MEKIQVLSVNLNEDGEFSEYEVTVSDECLEKSNFFGNVHDFGGSLRVYVALNEQSKIPEYKQQMISNRIKRLTDDLEYQFAELVELEQEINMYKGMQK